MDIPRPVTTPSAPLNGRGTVPRQANVKTRPKVPWLPTVLTIAIVALAGVSIWYFYFQSKPAAPATAASRVASPVPVTVVTLISQKTRLWNEFSGRLKSVDSAVIRPEVSGRITEIRFQDGQTVKAGDILLVIDPRPFQAAVDRDKANVAMAQSKLELAQNDEQRAQSLIGTHAIAQSDFDKFSDELHGAQASLDVAKADLAQALVDLDHAYVTAPISGRISRREVTLGNLVQSGPNAPELTSIVSNDGIYADFEVDEQTYLATIRDHADDLAEEKTVPVYLVVEGDTGRVYKGFVETFDNQLDVSSGTIRARAKFPNDDQSLLPGMFVSVRLANSQEQNVVLVPDRAIGFDQSKKFVFVVSPENKVAYREVQLGSELGGQRVVLKGLAAGDRVVVDGVQRVRPDVIVDPKEFDSHAGTTGGTAALMPVNEDNPQ